jgi:hypothetical protein
MAAGLISLRFWKVLAAHQSGFSFDYPEKCWAQQWRVSTSCRFGAKQVAETGIGGLLH